MLKWLHERSIEILSDYGFDGMWSAVKSLVPLDIKILVGSAIISAVMAIEFAYTLVYECFAATGSAIALIFYTLISTAIITVVAQILTKEYRVNGKVQWKVFLKTLFDFFAASLGVTWGHELQKNYDQIPEYISVYISLLFTLHAGKKFFEAITKYTSFKIDLSALFASVLEYVKKPKK